VNWGDFVVTLLPLVLLGLFFVFARRATRGASNPTVEKLEEIREELERIRRAVERDPFAKR
jgi:hypothetical protein